MGWRGVVVVDIEQQQSWSEEEIRQKLVVLKRMDQYYVRSDDKGPPAAAGVCVGGESTGRCRPKLSVGQLN